MGKPNGWFISSCCRLICSCQVCRGAGFRLPPRVRRHARWCLPSCRRRAGRWCRFLGSEGSWWQPAEVRPAEMFAAQWMLNGLLIPLRAAVKFGRVNLGLPQPQPLPLLVPHQRSLAWRIRTELLCF